MKTYDKPPLAVSEQIKKLEGRGLIFGDHVRAAALLQAVSYYRLSGYALPFEARRGTEHRFRDGTRFEDVVALYTFDHKLRTLLFDAIARIEMAFRTQITNHFSLEFGGWWYEEPGRFYKRDNQSRFLGEFDKEIGRSKETFIEHYRDNYGDPARPPAWIAFEVVTLGQLSRLYKNLRPCGPKARVADYFGLGIPVLENWMESLSVVRNACAHHSRVWNRQLAVQPIYPKRLPSGFPSTIVASEGDLARAYATLCLSRYLLDRIGTMTRFPFQVRALLAEYPRKSLHEMGFPDTWETEAFWQAMPSPTQETS